MANDYHNVSVRLNSEEYKQLEYIHNKYNRMSYGKVSLADVLRIAVKDLYLIEQEKDTPKEETQTPVTNESVLEQLEEVQKEVIEVVEDKPKPASNKPPKKTSKK